MMDVWFTAPALAEMMLPGLPRTPQNINATAKRENWPSRKNAGKGGGREYPLSALPEAARAEYGRRHHLNDGEAQALPVPGKRAVAALPPPSAIIPDWAFDRARARARLVMEWRAYCAARKHTPKTVATQDFILAVSAGALVPEAVVKTVGAYSLQSLYRWDKAMRDHNDNLDVLADRRGKWLAGGPKGLGQLGPEAESLLLGMWLTPNRPSMQLAYNAMKGVLQKRGLPVPSYDSARRFLQRFDGEHHDLVVLKREGEKALRDKVGPYIARNADILEVGDILFSDGHRLNFTSIHPTTGKPSRMTLIVWFDWRSRMPVGWEIMPEETTLSIASALYMGISNLGKKPRVVYIDNGKAFRANYFSSVSDIKELDGLYLRLGIDVQYSKPYAAQTKIVERFWGTFNEQCARLLPSYSGNHIDDKPAHFRRAEHYHKARHNDYVPTIQETAHMFAAYVRWYGNQPHKGLDGATPWSVFETGRGPGVDLVEMERHFLLRKQVTPKRTGFVISGIRFESDALYGINKPVLATYSWADLSQVALYDLETGARIGTARPVEALNPLAKHFGDGLDLQKVAEANKRQTDLRRTTLKLATELDGNDEALQALPWMRPAEERRTALAVVPKPTELEAPAAPELTAEERAELEAVAARLKEARDAAPAYRKPEFFRDEREKYEFLFEVSAADGKPLTTEDAAWMRDYEARPAYAAVAHRYERLRDLYAKRVSKQGAVA